MEITRTIPVTIAIGLIGTQLALANDQSSSSSNQQNTQQSNSATSTSQASQASKGQTILFSQLPEKVQSAMHAEAPGINIENIQKISKNGGTCYRGSFDRNGLKGRLTVAEDGSLLQYQESASYAMFEAAPSLNDRGNSKIQLSELPQAAREAVNQRAGSNQLGDVFKTTDAQSGKTAYHVAYTDGAVLTDLLVDEQGNVLYRADQTALYTAPLQNPQSLSLQSAPDRVQKAIREHGGSAQKISDIDKGTWNGKTVYKVMIERDGTFRPLLVSENGQIVQPGGSQASTGAAAESQTGASASSQENTNSKDQK